MIQLARGLCVATRLRVLDISNVDSPRIATAGVTAFAAALRHLSRLESLDFGGMPAHAQALRMPLAAQYRAHVRLFPILRRCKAAGTWATPRADADVARPETYVGRRRVTAMNSPSLLRV